MSVYSGFATRQQETFYYKLIFKSVELMGARILAFYNTDISFDERNWVRKMRKIYRFMCQMDLSKHVQPRLSNSMKDLIGYLNEIFGSVSNISKNPSSIIGSGTSSNIQVQQQNTASTLQIIEEEEQQQSNETFKGLKKIGDIQPKNLETNFKSNPSIPHEGPRVRFQKDTDRSQSTPNQTFFPNELQHLKSANRDVSQVQIQKLQYDEFLKHHTTLGIYAQREKYAQDLRHVDPKKGLSQYLTQGQIPVKVSSERLHHSDGKGLRPVNQDYSGDFYQIFNSRNSKIEGGAILPNVKSASRILNSNSLLDLVSGVSTASFIQRSDPYFTNGTQVQASNSNGTGYGISSQVTQECRHTIQGTGFGFQKPRSKILQNSSNQLTPVSKRSLNQYHKNDEEQTLLNYDLIAAAASQNINTAEKASSSATTNRKNRKMRKGDFEQPKNITILDGMGKGSESEQRPVIQVHAKHYHYNTNNIKIHMNNQKKETAEGLLAAESTDEDRGVLPIEGSHSVGRQSTESLVQKRGQIMKILDQLAKPSKNNDSNLLKAHTQHLIMPSNLGNIKPIKKFLIIPSANACLSKADTPTRRMTQQNPQHKKYFQIY